jgi:integrase
MLETFYAELRRCRIRCDGRPFIEHKAAGEHDCKAAKCKLHTCKPMAASTVRQVHSIISGTMNAAVRWDWASTNPTKAAQRPRQKPPQPDPPSPAMAAKLVEAAFEMDDDWGTLVWLVMTTGIRRGEVCALRWSRVDLDEGVIEIRSSYTLRRGVGAPRARRGSGAPDHPASPSWPPLYDARTGSGQPPRDRRPRRAEGAGREPGGQGVSHVDHLVPERKIVSVRSRHNQERSVYDGGVPRGRRTDDS